MFAIYSADVTGKPARPKFHVLFPIDYVTDAAFYSNIKKLVNSIFPYFDTKALDAARFFFGTATADVALYPERMNLTEYLNEDIFDADMPEGQYDGATIPEGSRNAPCLVLPEKSLRIWPGWVDFISVC